MLNDREGLKNVNQGTFIPCLQSGKRMSRKNERYGNVGLDHFSGLNAMQCSTPFNNMSLIFLGKPTSEG
jgi:hypothetical protein